MQIVAGEAQGGGGVFAHIDELWLQLTIKTRIDGWMV